MHTVLTLNSFETGWCLDTAKQDSPALQRAMWERQKPEQRHLR